MSGFFAALLICRRGCAGLLRHRALRLGLPLVPGLVTMYPFLKLASVYCGYAARSRAPFHRLMGWLASGRFFRSLGPMYLWFLIVLLILGAGAAAAAPLLDRALRGAWFGRSVERRAGMLLRIAVTTPTLLAMEPEILDTLQSFLPQGPVLAAYAVFFVFGWGLYLHRRRRDVLQGYRRGGIALGAACALEAGGAVATQLAWEPARGWMAFAGTALRSPAAGWLTIYGRVGVFLRRCAGETPRRRYLSDAACWIYLVHPPVLVAAQAPMLWLDWPAWAKLIAVLAFAIPVLVWRHGRRARPTWVGALLKGGA